MKKMVGYIDKLFRGYGEEFFGKEAMDQITDEQVEEARCEACKMLNELTAEFGKQEEGVVKELFYNYVFANFF